MLVAVMGRFTGEDDNIIHLPPLENVTLSGIRVCMCLKRLVSLLKEEGKTNSLAFCDMEGYMLSVDAIKSVFNPTLEEIKIHRDRNLSESIPKGMNV